MSTRAQRSNDRQAYLGTLDATGLLVELGDPRIITTYAEPHGHWARGAARPSLADDRPEVMCAIARCGVSRQRHAERFGGVSLTGVHTARCGWCDYPLAELLAALDWSIVESCMVTSEVWSWASEPYTRTVRINEYEHPDYRAFAAMSGDDQRRAIALAVAASSPPPPVTRAHDPWCSLDPSHDGDCPGPEEE